MDHMLTSRRALLREIDLERLELDRKDPLYRAKLQDLLRRETHLRRQIFGSSGPDQNAKCVKRGEARS
jgi:hypothetical protein